MPYPSAVAAAVEADPPGPSMDIPLLKFGNADAEATCVTSFVPSDSVPAIPPAATLPPPPAPSGAMIGDTHEMQRLRAQNTRLLAENRILQSSIEKVNEDMEHVIGQFMDADQKVVAMHSEVTTLQAKLAAQSAGLDADKGPSAAEQHLEGLLKEKEKEYNQLRLKDLDSCNRITILALDVAARDAKIDELTEKVRQLQLAGAGDLPDNLSVFLSSDDCVGASPPWSMDDPSKQVCSPLALLPPVTIEMAPVKTSTTRSSRRQREEEPQKQLQRDELQVQTLRELNVMLAARGKPAAKKKKNAIDALLGICGVRGPAESED
jgi:hypothetical protein